MSKANRNRGGKSARLQEIRGSQNFLTSRRLLERIVRKSTITGKDIVVEIGTGKGHLTEMLCRKAGFVYSVEIDTDIVKKLTEDSHPPSEIWLVMEKGAAKRFMGVPKETKYSLSLKCRWKLDIAYYFSRGDFHPKPSVDSVLLHFFR